ncbi:MAG: hypothetical protein BWX98_02292 [Candidatus Aminicenantes bacterium ADurb.Bin147]|nr:MAG: hypothetical protein BWX98_02292 [Candidatus Aminicenantes bacterium ADurb.Bin147]
MADFHLPVLDGFEQVPGFQVGDDPSAGVETVDSGVGPGRGVERTVGVEDVDDPDFVLVPLPDAVVVGIVGRRDLDAAGPEGRIGPGVDDEREGAVEKRQAEAAPVAGHVPKAQQQGEDAAAARFEILEGLFKLGPVFFRGGRDFNRGFGDSALELGGRIGMDGDGRVAEHCLRAGRGHDDEFRFAGPRLDDRVADVPEMALDFFMDDFVVRDGRLELAVPVDQAVAPIDEPVGEEPKESFPDGPGADGVHGEALPLPVAGAAHPLLLADDPGLVFVLPSPDPGHQGVAAEVMAGLSLELEEALFHDSLGRDAGMVRPRHPEGVVAGHPAPADEQVLHDVVHGVAHVQGPGDVGQGHHDDVPAVAAVGDGGEGVGRKPALRHPPLVRGRFIQFRDFIRHGLVLRIDRGPIFTIDGALPQISPSSVLKPPSRIDITYPC